MSASGNDRQPPARVHTVHPLVEGDELLTLAAGATLVSCSTKTLRRRIADGQMPAYGLGRLIRIRRGDLLAAFAPITSKPPGLDDFITRQIGG